MSAVSEPVRLAVVGLGYWGPNLARAVARTPGCELTWACDAAHANLDRYRIAYPTTRFTDSLVDVLEDGDVDGVIVATGAGSHHTLGMQVLEAGKHALIEKPLALSAADAQELVETAQEHDLQLMVGHLLRFHPGFEKVEQIIAAGELGRVLYLYSNRVNFGKVRTDENALWSLGPHDISLALALAGDLPQSVSARGACFLQPEIEDVVFAYLDFPSGIVAHLHLSWLDPHKRRALTVVGTERMVVFDDVDSERKVTIYEKTSLPKRFETWGEYQALSSGDITIPAIAAEEPLSREVRSFRDRIRGEDVGVVASGEEGLAVVRVLEALSASLATGGTPIPIERAGSAR